MEEFRIERLETERLILSPFVPEDAEGLYEYAKDPDVGPHAGWKPHESIEESLAVIREMFMKNGVWAIRLKGSDRLIGSIGLEPDKFRQESESREIGYSLAKDCWGRGLMPEAVRAVLDYGFYRAGLKQVGICTGPENKRSQRVIEKVGFTYEGTIRRAYRIYTGHCRDSLCYSMLKEEWDRIRSGRQPFS